MSNLNDKPISYGNLSRFYDKLKTNKLNDIESSIEGKQDVLTAGDNITISDNTISADGYTYDSSNGAFSNNAFSPEGSTYVNSATGQNAIALGQGNTVSSEGAATIGGQDCTVTGDVSVSMGGYQNNISGDYAACVSGQYNEVTGTQSVALGSGNSNFKNYTSGDFSITGGRWVKTTGTSSLAIGMGSRNANKYLEANGLGSISLGVCTVANNQSEVALGSSNVSHTGSSTYNDAGNTQLSVGLFKDNTGYNCYNGLEIMQNGDSYMYGVGGYVGTDTKVQDSTIKTVQEVISGKQDTLTAGQNISIEDNTLSAIGYAAGKSATSSFVELPEIVIEPYTDITSQLPSTDLYFTGDAGSTTYTVSGQLTAMVGSMVGMAAFQVGSGNIALLTAYDSTNSTVTLDKTLDADNALSNTQVSKIYMAALVYFSGDAGATTYNIVDSMGASGIFADAQKIKIGDYPIATIVSIDSTNNTITLSETLDDSNAVSNAQFMYAIQNNNTASGAGAHAEGAGATASGIGSHAEGDSTTAEGQSSHSEGMETTASGTASHAEGYDTTASGGYSHAEGKSTIASGDDSHTEGTSTVAEGNYSHAEGYKSQTTGNTTAFAAHAEGSNTIAQNYAEHAEGTCNVSHQNSTQSDDGLNTIHSIGIGKTNARKNAIEVLRNGDMYVYGIGGYQGTDTTVQDSTIQTLQAYIASLEARIAALENA